MSKLLLAADRPVRAHEAALVKLMEELSECAKELSKVLRGKGDLDHLAEEIADATIMLEQIRYILGLNEEVCRWMDSKVKRLDTKLKRGTQA